MASSDLDACFRELFRDMADAWRAAPSPPGIHMAEVDLAGLARVGATAVIHGWMARLVRSGEAALLLDQQGYGEETSPLLRSMLEHAIGLWWLVDDRGDAFQALVRSRSHQLDRLRRAQEQGWPVGDDNAQQRLEEAIATETEEESKWVDHLLAVAAQANKYALGSVFQAWLIESWTSHASFASARAYFLQGHDADEDAITLLHEPVSGHREVAASVASALHTALRAYDRLLAGEPLVGFLAESQQRFEELGVRLMQENAQAR